MSPDKVQQGLKRKELYEGKIRLNKRNFFDAYVTADGFEDDIYIPGKFKRNRALDGDDVVVKILEGPELDAEIDRDNDKKAERKREEIERNLKCVFEEDSISEEEPKFEDENTGNLHHTSVKIMNCAANIHHPLAQRGSCL
jgi:exoribonuclease R